MMENITSITFILLFCCSLILSNFYLCRLIYITKFIYTHVCVCVEKLTLDSNISKSINNNIMGINFIFSLRHKFR